MKNLVKTALVAAMLVTTFASCSSNPKPAEGDDTSTFTNNGKIVKGNTSKDTANMRDSNATRADTSSQKPK